MKILAYEVFSIKKSEEKKMFYVKNTFLLSFLLYYRVMG